LKAKVVFAHQKIFFREQKPEKKREKKNMEEDDVPHTYLGQKSLFFLISQP